MKTNLKLAVDFKTSISEMSLFIFFMQVKPKESKNKTGSNPETRNGKDTCFPPRGRGNDERRALWLANFITTLNYFLFWRRLIFIMRD
jgi:hypothetical protein